MNAITEFRGKYRWLSNFWPCRVVLDGVEYPSVENAYQAAKFHPSSREPFRTCTAKEAKARGHKASIEHQTQVGVLPQEDYDRARVGTMTLLLRQKFAPGTELGLALRHTGDAEIIEGNTWGDTFWGVCDGVGQNWLGKLLMEQRKAVQLVGYEVVCTDAR